ncbi:hypothetical protein MTO96_025971 [Rhipicephalus appendiculatus]
MGSSSGIWVFGYGSLVWNPGFEFERSQIGYIRGYDRRFWQGNDKHRGTPEKVRCRLVFFFFYFVILNAGERRSVGAKHLLQTITRGVLADDLRFCEQMCLRRRRDG